MELQRLGNLAFPTLHGQERDIMLKGHFYQALQVRWQRKLGAPETDETFKELYDRARMLEQREKQYANSAAARGDGSREGGTRKNFRPSLSVGRTVKATVATAAADFDRARVL